MNRKQYAAVSRSAASADESDAQPNPQSNAESKSNKKESESEPKDQHFSLRWLRSRHIIVAISIFVPPVLAILYFSYDPEVIFIISGVYGILFNLYLLNRFRILIGLRYAVNITHSLNMEFRNESRALALDVKELGDARMAIQDTQRALHENNLKIMDMIQRFDQLVCWFVDLIVLCLFLVF